MSLEKMEARERAQPDTGREDYNQVIRFGQIQPGEPVFVIRGRDAVSSDAVRAWAALAHQAGAALAIVESALQQADAMAAWPDKHIPDAGHLTPQQAQQLQYELERRAWRAREDCADPRVMLAEERGLAAAMGRLRPILQLFFEGLTADGEGSYTFTMPRLESGKPKSDFCPVESLRRLSTALRGAPPASSKEPSE